MEEGSGGEEGGGQAAQIRVSSPLWGKLHRPWYLTPHPFLFREEWLMVHFMTIQMTDQKESLFSDKLSFGMESASFLALLLASKATIFWTSISSYQVKDAYAHKKIVFPCIYHKDFYLKGIKSFCIKFCQIF